MGIEGCGSEHVERHTTQGKPCSLVWQVKAPPIMQYAGRAAQSEVILLSASHSYSKDALKLVAGCLKMDRTTCSGAARAVVRN